MYFRLKYFNSMKLWKHSVLTAIAFFGISTTVFITSCEEDSCLELKCLNGGSCADGFCRCKTGYEGTECEIKTTTKFVGRFIGNKTCGGQSPFTDTVEIFISEEPITVKYVQYSRKTDTLTGTVSERHLTIPIITSGSYRRTTSADILNNKITVYNEEITDVNDPETKQVCNFIGFK